MKYQDRKRWESIMMSRLLVSNGKEGKRQKLGWMRMAGINRGGRALQENKATTQGCKHARRSKNIQKCFQSGGISMKKGKER
jgi:hypothetical protein